MLRLRLALTGLLGTFLGLGLATCGGDDGGGSSCQPGTAGCECLAGTCQAGLVCSGGICVYADGADDGGTGDSGTGDDGTDGGDDGTDDGGTDDGGSTGGSEEGGPEIISFGTNVSQITEGESVIFTAVVTDPDGIEDVIGGELKSADETITYGSFATAGQEGSYELTLSWAEIHQAAPIAFDQDADDPRTFRAEFYDQTAKTAWKTTDITLHCDGSGCCDGVCKDMPADNENCGACGVECTLTDANNHPGYAGTCVEGECQPTLGECIQYDDGYANCDEYCTGAGESCVQGGCFGATWMDYTDGCGSFDQLNEFSDPCNTEIQWETLMRVRCCCTQTP